MDAMTDDIQQEIRTLRAQLQEAKETALRVVGESGWIADDYRHEVLKEMTDALTQDAEVEA